jgi:hypothetical protein
LSAPSFLRKENQMKIFWFVMNGLTYVIRLGLWGLITFLILSGTYYHSIEMQAVGVMVGLFYFLATAMQIGADTNRKILEDYFRRRNMKGLII